MNKVLNAFGKVSNVYGAIIFIVVGLLFCIISYFAFDNSKKFDAETTATIVKVDVYYNNRMDEEDYSYDVRVNYTVDGQDYRDIEYPAYSSTMKVGDKVNIKYNSSNPKEIQSDDLNVMLLIFVILGMGSFGFGAYRLIKIIKTPNEID